MVMGFDYSGYNLTTTAKNCSSVQYGGCNESYICNSVNNSVVSSGGILTECSVSCCQSDLCNGPGILLSKGGGGGGGRGLGWKLP